MKTPLILILTLFIFMVHKAEAQILHTESFSVILDSTRHIKGSIVPDFKFQTQKENLIEFENISDITYKFKHNVLTFANKIEMSKYGDEVIMSGGYLYLEYRKIFDRKITLEPYSQLNWSEARGLVFKYAGGFYLRYRAKQTQEVGIFAGIGTFYEYERWNYEAVYDRFIPVDISEIVSKQMKLGSYVSLKWFTEEHFNFDFSIYHQSRFDEIFSTPRLAGSGSITYFFTEHLGLTLIYQNIYDFKPVVPIEQFFHRVLFTLDVTF